MSIQGHSARGVVEVVGPRDVPIHLLESSDGVDWGDPADLGRLLVARDGVSLSGTPNLAWHDGASGPVIIATGRHSLRDGDEGNRALVSTDLGTTRDSFELPTSAERHDRVQDQPPRPQVQLEGSGREATCWPSPTCVSAPTDTVRYQIHLRVDDS